MKTPLALVFSELPDYTFLKVFGCACWPHLRPYNSRKLEFRSKKCVFLGYSALHKGYKCLHVPTNRVYISRDVVFDENLFPFSNMPSSPTLSSPTNISCISPDQLEDVAYSPVLLPNHGAGTGRGARLELLAEQESPGPASDDCDVDRCMGHAAGARTETASSAPPGPAATSPTWLAGSGPPMPRRRASGRTRPARVGQVRRLG